MNKRTAGIGSIVAILIGLVAIACGSSANASSPFVVELTGTASGEVRTINGSELTCFDLDMMDPSTGTSLGTATDCLDMANVVPIGSDGGFVVINTTFFNFKDGTIVSVSETTIQPVSDPLPSSGPTHVTGEVSVGNNISADLGTGKFKGATGGTRLSGLVDLSRMPEGIVTFACIFVIDVNET